MADEENTPEVIEFDTGDEVNLTSEEAELVSIDQLNEAIAATGGRPYGGNQMVERHNHPTKKYVTRAKRKRLRKLETAARRASRGTTTSRKGQRSRINNSAAK